MKPRRLSNRMLYVIPRLEDPAEKEIEDAFDDVKEEFENFSDKIDDNHGILLSLFVFFPENTRHGIAVYIIHYRVFAYMLQLWRPARNILPAIDPEIDPIRCC